VDTPGTGSIHAANTAGSTRARTTADPAVLVVAADPPVSAAEVALVAEVRSTASAGAVVLNKTDLIEPADLAEIVTFTRQAVSRVLNTDLPVFAMSLRGTGIHALIEWLAARLAEHGARDVVAAAARALCSAWLAGANGRAVS
jgi:predicted GTPase